ncbi:hypothetical protein [Rhodovulum adriaticum]|uniref:Esterase n=1 Tax=Rhodovulum adriaticum TaxID=35804 RepID=A0A4R2NVD5_RHOAD|nr:hypothetical protein [Rhodovulum adriaticum]MBK1636891.1 hypothetical protein [Rhodovulum adriaticum]TCP25365.1 hypothetical protein EV656_103114 [Rhodovulum adriaticum]
MLETIGPDAVFQRGQNDHLVVVFSSLATIFTGQYEGMALLRNRPEHVLYLREPVALAFHTGLTGLTTTIPETVEFLNYFAQSIGATRRSHMGASSGGYAAILYGLLCRVDDVFAVNPATFVSEGVQTRLSCPPREHFPLSAFRDHYDRTGQPLAHGDLSDELRERAGAVKVIGVHYAANDETDRINACHLTGCPDTFTIAHNSDQHVLLTFALAEQGVLNHHLVTPLDQLRSDYRALADQQAPA